MYGSGRLCRLKNNEGNDFVKTIIKRAVSAITAIALTLSCILVFDVPQKAAAEGTHSHKACAGTAHDGCTHGNIEFEPYPDIENNGGIILRGKSYYLTKDIVLSENSRIFVEKGVSNLCLNGHSITKANGQIIDINQIDGQSAELNICDCVGTGKIVNTSDVSGYACINVIDDSRFNLYGGCIDGGAQGGGIDVHNYSGATGAANIYGGLVQTRDNYGVWLHEYGSSLSVYGGEIRTSDYHTVCVTDEHCKASVYGGKISGSSENYDTLRVWGEGASADINGGEVIGQTGQGTIKCIQGTVEIKGGEVKSESQTGTCIINADTLVISGGTVSCSGYYGINNHVDYRDGAISPGITTIRGGTVNSAGSAIYNGEKSTVEIKGGKITSEQYSGIYNYGTLKISDGEIKAKGTYTLDNYNDAVLKISGGTVETENYALYNRSGSFTEIDGGKLTGGAVCVWNNGTLNASGGEIISGMNPVVNHGSLDISGGKWGTTDSANYIKNAKGMKLSGSPSFINASIWLTTDDNIEITGELTYSAPCPIYVDSSVPRSFTDGWSAHMSGKAPSDYFKSPYSLCTVAKSEGGEALLRVFAVTFDANGGTCNTASASVDGDGKIPSLPAAAYGEYPFDGWYTEKRGGEKITTDTVFEGDATVYAHYIGYEAPDGSISMEIQHKDNVPDTKLNASVDELAKAVLTPEEQEELKNGADIKIILIVSDATKTVPTADKEKVEAAIKELDGYMLGQYLDLNLLKIIGSSEGVKITQTNKPIRVTFEIPSELREKAEYSVIRVHGGTVTILPDLDSDPDTVTIETDKFSTYALTYKERTADDRPNGGNGAGIPTITPVQSGNSDTTSSESGTSSATVSSDYEGSQAPDENKPDHNNKNPSTGAALPFIPLTAIAAAIAVMAAKGKDK